MVRAAQALQVAAWKVAVFVVVGVMVSWGCGALLLGTAAAVATVAMVSTVTRSEAAHGPRPLWENISSVAPSAAAPLVTPFYLVTLQGRELRGIALNNPWVWRWLRESLPLGLEQAQNLALAEDIVLLAGHGAAAYRLATGEPLWSAPFANSSWPAGRTDTDGESFFVPRGTGALLALDVRTGTTRWETPVLDACPSACRPGGALVAGDTVYVGMSVRGAADDHAGAAVVAALDRRTGQVLWRARADSGHDELTVPFAARGRTLVVGTPNGTRVAGLDRVSRDWSWTRDVALRSAVKLPDVQTDALLFVSKNARLVKLDVTSGVALSRDDGASGITPALTCAAGANVVIAGGGIRWLSLQSERVTAGQLLRRNELVSSVAARGGVVYVVGDRGTVAAYPCGR